jgi:prophage antirepressor-like protein
MMRNLLYQYFGELSNDALIIHEDGRDWVSSKSLCDLMGIHCEYNLVKDLETWPAMNLTDDDKRKFSAEGAHHPFPIWFISETGFWKIVARSHSLWAAKFRASFLPSAF